MNTEQTSQSPEADLIVEDTRKCPRCKTRGFSSLLVSRHCLEENCGYSQQLSQAEKIEQGLIPLHKKLEPDAGFSLLRLISLHNLTLPSNAIEWRGKDYVKGALKGLISTVYLIATDGIVAWFLLGDKETPFFGHLANFEEAKEDKAEGVTSTGPRRNGKLLIQLAQED